MWAPDGLHDRARDHWAILFAIADLAGGGWPEVAREAALSLSGDGGDEMTSGSMLLRDVRVILDEAGLDRISSEELVLKQA